MNETIFIKSPLPSVTSSFLLSSLTKGKSVSLLNSQISTTQGKLTKKSSITSSLLLRPHDISPIIRLTSNPNSSFTSFIKERPLTKPAYTSRGIAFTQSLPKKNKTQLTTSTPSSHQKPKDISKEIINISRIGLPHESSELYHRGIKKSSKPLIKIFSIISPKKRINSLFPTRTDLKHSVSPEEYRRGVYAPVRKYQRKLANHHFNAVHSEIAVQYSNVFSLINKKKFTEKYRVPFDLNSHHNSNSNEHFLLRLKSMNIDKDISEIIHSKHEKCKQKSSNDLLQRYKAVLIKAAIHFKKMNISIVDFYNRDYTTIKPFDGNESALFLEAIKSRNVSLALKMIEKNNYLLFDFDEFKQTPLHWAAKRNVYQIIHLMISKGANVNARDASGRTPLHHAARMNHLEAVEMLLYGLANPFIKCNNGRLANALTKSSVIKFILQRTALLHSVLQMGKTKAFEKKLKDSLDILLIEELKTKFGERKRLWLEHGLD